jgi:hypothetical protein
MKSGRRQTLRSRIANLRERLGQQVESDADTESLHALVERLELLERVERRRWQRRSMFWLIIAMVIAIACAAILRLAVFRSADLVLAATANAFTVAAGTARLDLISDGVAVHEIAATGGVSELSWRELDARSPSQTGSSFRDIQLNALHLNPNSVGRLREDGPCFEFEVVSGTAEADATAFPVTANPPAGRVRPAVESISLSAYEAIRFCPQSDAAIRLARKPPGQGMVSLGIADFTGGAVAERERLPSIVQGTLAISDVANSIELRRTDTLRAAGVSSAVLVARLQHPISIAMAGTATTLTLGTGTGELSVMPNWLDYVRSNPALHSALALLIAIAAAAFALRERFLSEL